MIARRRVFDAVFPIVNNKPLATPQSTPLIGTGSFGVASGQATHDDGEHFSDENVAWDRATESLRLPQASVLNNPRDMADIRSNDPVKVIQPLVRLNRSKIQDLTHWYIQEMSQHYVRFEFPKIFVTALQDEDVWHTIEKLKELQDRYLYPWHRHAQEQREPETAWSVQVRTACGALVSTSIAQTTLTFFIKQRVSILVFAVFGLEIAPSTLSFEDRMDVGSLETSQKYQEELFQVLYAISEVGLRIVAERVLAEVIYETITKYVHTRYELIWNTPSTISSELAKWIDFSMVPFVSQALNSLVTAAGEGSFSEPLSTSWNSESLNNKSKIEGQEIASLKTRAVDALGALRLNQLFELVVGWDDSRGAIEDLKSYITSTSARTHVTSQFSEDLSRRLLQPGASTAQILDIYVRLIQIFVVLDPRGVLLDRVARPVRRYLRERDDTVKLIVCGLLADPTDEDNPDPLAILAIKLEEAAQVNTNEDEAELDWDNMEWMPDPMDAEPEYKRSKSSDIIGNLISLFETRDVFVKEFQNILGERLLQVKNDFTAEEKLLELLKLRFGEGPLQSCEVMLYDIGNSIRIDNWIKREQIIESSTDMSAKTLSRLYWPALHTETFKIPTEIQKLQSAYSTGFERYKTSRKLAWLDVLGDVTVELELEDRTILETVKTPQAAIIYAFQSDDNTPITKTAEQLMEDLEMDEDLVENGLLFWVGKLVLVKSAGGEYTVLERLPDAAQQDANLGDASKSSTLAAAAMASASAAAAPVSALRSDEDIAEEKMQIYWQFIVGMLTNQGAMPLPRMVMMLKIAMAGGFPYSNDELKSFLSKRVDEGKLELVGGNYKLVRSAN